jgi:hypothetical protein
MVESHPLKKNTLPAGHGPHEFHVVFFPMNPPFSETFEHFMG